MRLRVRIIVLALLPAVAMAAAAGKKLPERTSFEAFIAFIDQAIGETELPPPNPTCRSAPAIRSIRAGANSSSPRTCWPARPRRR